MCMNAAFSWRVLCTICIDSYDGSPDTLGITGWGKSARISSTDGELLTILIVREMAAAVPPSPRSSYVC
eukprot:12788773-Ditylum_brightwellii.AAC.1